MSERVLAELSGSVGSPEGHARPIESVCPLREAFNCLKPAAAVCDGPFTELLARVAWLALSACAEPGVRPSHRSNRCRPR
jgi:hypothetical protein